MARPERVTFGLLLASSSSELMNARMTSFVFPQSQCHHYNTHDCHFHPFHCCQHLPCCHPGISQCWLASSERTSLLLAWMSYDCLYFLTHASARAAGFKYLFSSGTRSYLSLVTSSHRLVQG